MKYNQLGGYRMTKERMIQKLEEAKRAVRYTTWTGKAGYHVKDWFETCTINDNGATFFGILFPYDEILDVEVRPYFNGMKKATVMFKNGEEHDLIMSFEL